MENRAYAGFFVRLIAYMIDSVIAFVAAGLIKIPFGIAAGVGLSALRSNFLFQYSFIDVVGYVGMVLYFILMTYFTHSTLGKMLFRLEVVSTDEKWSLINIIYRETVGRFLSGLMFIGYLAVIISNKRQGFHDMLCDTYVVYRDMVRPIKPAVAVAGAGNVYCNVESSVERAGNTNPYSSVERVDNTNPYSSVASTVTGNVYVDDNRSDSAENIEMSAPQVSENITSSSDMPENNDNI